jgi:hypothetical protein
MVSSPLAATGCGSMKFAIARKYLLLVGVLGGLTD